MCQTIWGDTWVRGTLSLQGWTAAFIKHLKPGPFGKPAYEALGVGTQGLASARQKQLTN